MIFELAFAYLIFHAVIGTIMSAPENGPVNPPTISQPKDPQ
jgi:hypothetical protein